MKLLFHLGRCFLEAQHRLFVDLVRRTHVGFPRLDHLIDRLQKELAHDEVVEDENHYDREQRVIGRQIDLHRLFGAGKTGT